MDYVSRLIALLLLFLPFAASAVISPVSIWRVQIGPSGYTVPSFDVAGCKSGVSQHYGANYPFLPTTTFAASSATNGTCSGSWGTGTIFKQSEQCPANSISVAGNCVCQAGFEDVDGACVPENGCPAAGTQEGSAGELYETTGSYPPSSICSGGCSWSTSGGEGCLNGKCFYKGPLTSLNQTCVPNSPGPGDGTTPPTGEPEQTPPEDKQCVEKGLCPFYYNGTKFCTKCDTKEGTSSESGSSSTDSTDADGNPTGSTGSTNTTKQTTANCTGDRCTTSTTTTTQNPDGTTTVKTETGELDKGDFCSSNPGHVVCKGDDEGTFGGSCDSDFQCTGDAVQCAQAREVAKLRCVFDVSPDDPLAVAGGLAMNGELTPTGHPGAPGSGLVVDVMEQIDTAPAFGSSGNCISDRTFSVIGMSLTLPFASMCPYFNMIGNVFLSCCYLVAGFIVFRR